MDNNVCPICKLENVQRGKSQKYIDVHEINCERCGNFAIEGTHPFLMGDTLDEDDKHLLPYLSAYTRQATGSGIQSGCLTRYNWRDLARAHTTTSVSQKVTKLLELVAARSAYPGYRVLVNAGLDYPLLDAASEHEVKYLLSHLEDLNYIREEGGRPYYSLTVKGWERLEPPAGGGGIPGRCFIAMSFDLSLNDAYLLGIEPAVRDCKFDPRRIDQVPHNEEITDKILAEIRLAQFIVADFTYHRGGVYFEAGFAMGLGRPVIWTCREDDFKNTHFDTNHYNHIIWSTPEDLRTKLTDRIRATILK